jgi:polyhydroxybutyrate depolymerase
VFVFHGNPGDANGMRWIGFDEISDLEHFIVIYPEGVEQSWNTGAKGPGSAIAQNVDESAFIKKILSDLEKIVKFDPKRIHAIGYSQGGSLVYRLACNMSDTFAAIASISGSMEYSPCNPSQAVSVIHVHGLEDRKVPFSGGGPWELSPIEKGINTWVNLDNCTDSAKEEDYSNGITHVSYTSCQSGTSVELYTIDSGDHTWPSKDEISTSEVIWDFFASHPKP